MKLNRQQYYQFGLLVESLRGHGIAVIDELLVVRDRTKKKVDLARRWGKKHAEKAIEDIPASLQSEARERSIYFFGAANKIEVDSRNFEPMMFGALIAVITAGGTPATQISSFSEVQRAKYEALVVIFERQNQGECRPSA